MSLDPLSTSFHGREEIPHSIDTGLHREDFCLRDLLHAELQSLRLSDPDAELERLRSNTTIREVLDRVEEQGYSREHLIALGHAVEIREKLKETHYTLLHGQNAKFMISHLIAKKLQEFMQGAPVEGYNPLRCPCFTEHVQANQTPDQTPDWFRHECDISGDHNFIKELACVDAYFGSTEMESANATVKGTFGFDEGIIRKLIESQLKDSFPGKDIRPLLDAFMKLYSKIESSLKSEGCFYGISVPKDKFSEIGYLSTSFGKTHRDCEGRPVDEVLKQLQSDDLTGFHSIPQIRLLRSKLTQEEGVQIFDEPILSNDFLMKVDREICKAIVDFIVGEHTE